MVILELGDVLGDNLVATELYAILLAINSTYLAERLGYALTIIADMCAKKVYVQCGTGDKSLVGIHQCTTFQVEIITIMGLGNTIQQTFLKVSSQNCLIEHFLLLSHIEQPCPDGFTIVLYLTHSFSAIYCSRILLTLSLSA